MAPLFIDGHSATWTAADEYIINSQATRFELFENSLPVQLAFKEALAYLNNLGIENIYEYNRKIGQSMREKLSAIPGVTLYDRGSRLCNIITFRKEGVKMEEMKSKLQDHDVYFGIGVKQHAMIDYQKKGLEWLVRFSPHYFNTEEEIDQVAQIVEDI